MDFEDDELEGLFGGEDLLSLLENVQNQQDLESAGSGAVSTAGSEKESTPETGAAVSSEQAFQKLMGSLSEDEVLLSAAVRDRERTGSLLSESTDDEIPGALPVEAGQKHSMDDYDKSLYGFAQLDEIKKGVERGLNVSYFDSVELNFRQMREIRIGLEQGLDVSFYSSHYYKDTQMREIRLGLMEKIDVGSYARLIYSLPDMQRKRQELLRKKFQRDPYSLEMNLTDKDTGITIYTADGLMSAWIRVGKDLPQNFSRKNLQNLLKIYGIEKGLLVDKIEADKLKPGDELEVARGEQSVQGEDGFYEYFVESPESEGPHVDENGNIDYSAEQNYSYVQPGQRVALYHPATHGSIGFTVTGLELLAVSGKNLPRLPLDKIRLLDDGVTYVSKKEGLAVLKNGILDIVEQLEFKEDVGYGVNVSYAGNIYVRASVLESAVLHAGGDIIVDGFVEGAILKAGGDIILRRGMNADGKGELEAGGGLIASFIENANIVVGGNIECGYILNSNVFSKGMVKTSGIKNMICGGRVVASNGIWTGVVGNKTQTKTDLEVGSFTEAKTRASEIYQRRKQLLAEMDKVQEGMMTVLRKIGALHGRTNPVYLKFQDVLEQQKAELAALDKTEDEVNEEIEVGGRLYITVETMAYENTKLMINGAVRILQQDIPKARFFARGKEIVYDHYAGV
ncbi:MAG: FapA family protein [Lachnospiraceae bacterium]|nr:FapA family protein [Lachnospiraceae bacterium]